MLINRCGSSQTLCYNTLKSLIEEMRKKMAFFNKSPSKKLVICNEGRNFASMMPQIHKIKSTQPSSQTPRKKSKPKEKTQNMVGQEKRDNKTRKLLSNNQKTIKLVLQKQEAPNKENQPIQTKLHATRLLRSRSQINVNYAQAIKNTRTSYLQEKNYQKTELEQCVETVYKFIVSSVCFPRKSSIFTGKKDTIVAQISFLLQILSQNQTQFLKSYLSSNEELFEASQNLKAVFDGELRKAKVPKLSFDSIVKCKIIPEDIREKESLLLKKVACLQVQIVNLDEKVSIQQKKLSTLNELCAEKQKEITTNEKKIYELNQNIQKQTLKSQELTNCIAQKSILFQSMDLKAQQLLNFVQIQQQKKILHCVSEAYKQIQAQIYDYACYLQCNAMASSLTWEPKPFRAVQKWVYEEMERVNVFVTSKAESFEDKVTKMRDFVTNTTRKFRTKDQEMMKIADFKTECIKKFTKMMQKWLQNWELKQEYLVTLRKQFAIQSESMNQIFHRLENYSAQKNKLEPCEIGQLLDQLRTKWLRIELNYKYSNSFY